ncbi:hypothetical protein GQ55_3G140200 [Panicum hallii var. hallii]|uniref:Uncharacterized protein n=1 Tax=Panicum hallii var. hallii TaxID=1504633 RepID=A0A2T7E990_9POAL|nr:hypothetical protein GQ55_3G140200 [Panicum hallii var. hallii]
MAKDVCLCPWLAMTFSMARACSAGTSNGRGLERSSRSRSRFLPSRRSSQLPPRVPRATSQRERERLGEGEGGRERETSRSSLPSLLVLVFLPRSSQLCSALSLSLHHYCSPPNIAQLPLFCFSLRPSLSSVKSKPRRRGVRAQSKKRKERKRKRKASPRLASSLDYGRRATSPHRRRPKQAERENASNQAWQRRQLMRGAITSRD